MTVVLDASALLASLRNEPGAERVVAVLDGALISVANFTEVAEYYTMCGADREQLERLTRGLPVIIVPADTGVAVAAALLKPLTRAEGLSLGDRFCLALAAQRRLRVLTADRAWARVADSVGVEIEIIR